MPFETILTDFQDRVAILTLNRPDKLNALSLQLRQELSQALEEADHDDEVRCVILTGAGRAFSAGGDVPSNRKEFPRRDVLEWLNWSEYSSRLHAGVSAMRKPVIAAINGLCYGAALKLITYCDLRLASDQATFAMIETRAGNGGPALLPFLIGADWTKMLLFTGDAIDAHKAKEIGLVTEVLPHERLQENALALGKRIAAMPPIGVRLNKQSVDLAMASIGQLQYERYVRAFEAMTNTMSTKATTPDGRNLNEIRSQFGIKEFIRARDEAFQEPWP